MKLDKKDILKALETITIAGEGKNMVESGAVTNVVTFGDEIIVDLVLHTPAMHIKKRAEDDIKKTIHELVSKDAKIKVNIKVETPEASEIKGKAIPGMKNIIAIASGKGGVGKSTVTANLAVTLAKMGFKVGILDADIYGPSMPIMFDVESEKPISVTVDGKSKMKPVESYEVKILSIGFFTAPSQAVIWRGPMASKALNQMIFDADWGELDFMLIDLPPGTGDIQLTLVQTIPLTGAVIVTTPQEVSLIDARKALKMFERVNVPILGVVENMSYFIAPDTGNKYDIFGSGGGEKICKELNTTLLGGIPIDPRIRQGGDDGVPMVFGIPDANETKILMAISRKLTEQVNIRNSNASEKIEILLGDED